MAGCPIIRFDKLKTSAEISGRAGHHLRTIPVKNADAERTPENQVLMGLDVPAAIRKRVMDMTKPLMKRKDNVRCLEVFLGASDDFWDAGGDWVELAKAHKQMLISEFGEKNIIGFGWHLDEGRPHGWAFIAPITPDGRLAASHWVDGPSKLKQMLTRVQPFYNPLGMERAKEGVRATHLEMHDIHAANAGNKRAKKQIDDELASRAENALELAQRVEQKVVQARADLELLEAEKAKAKQAISDAKAEADKLVTDAKDQLKAAQILIEKGEENLRKQAGENEKFRLFLNNVAVGLKSVFQQLPEAVFLKLPDRLQDQLMRFFRLTPIERPVEPARPVLANIPLPDPSKAAPGLLGTLAKPPSKPAAKPH